VDLYSVIILDYNMPSATGLEVLLTTKDLYRDFDVVLPKSILITAIDDPRLMEKAKQHFDFIHLKNRPVD
jgi:CheY-like chemotaxis protein